MWTLRWATTWARILDHCAVRRQSWGRGPSPQGWRRLQARRLTCLLLRALQRRRVESLVLGALSSSPVDRALVLVLGTNIAVLLDCSKSSRQCSLPSFLTYLGVVGLKQRSLAASDPTACSPGRSPLPGRPPGGSQVVIRVIREDPAGAVVVRAWPGHRNIGRGSCRSALADGVRSTAVVRGLSVHSRRRPNGSLRPVNRSPPPSASSVGVGRHRGSKWVRQFSPP